MDQVTNSIEDRDAKEYEEERSKLIVRKPNKKAKEADKSDDELKNKSKKGKPKKASPVKHQRVVSASHTPVLNQTK